MYLYKTIIYHDETGVAGLPAGNTADNTDFETNYKSLAMISNSVPLGAEGLIIEKSYTDFKLLITGEISWSDVVYVQGVKSYTIFLQTNLTDDIRSLKQRASDLNQLFSVSTNKRTLSAAAGTETPFILFDNPSGSDVKIKFSDVQCRLHDVSSYSVILRSYHMPTVTTNGTALSPVKENMNGGGMAASKWYVSPTVSANGMFRNAFQFSHEVPLDLDYNLSHQMGSPSKMLFTLEKNIAGDVDVIMSYYFVEKPI